MGNVNKIILSTVQYDPNGYVEMTLPDEVGGLYDRTRRGTVTQTLDGGVVFEDAGFSHGDRTLTVNVSRLPLAVGDRLRYLFEEYSDLYISVTDGVFLAALLSYTRQKGQDVIKVQLLEKLTEE